MKVFSRYTVRTLFIALALIFAQCNKQKTAEGKRSVDRSLQMVNGIKVTLVKISGAYLAPTGPMMQSQGKKENYRLLGAIAEAPEGSVFFKFTGPAATVSAAEESFNTLISSIAKLAGSRPAPTSAVAGIRWTVPGNWGEHPPRQMRVATYMVPAASGDAEGGECAVFYFGNDQGGSIDANIERWVAQFEEENSTAK